MTYEDNAVPPVMRLIYDQLMRDGKGHPVYTELFLPDRVRQNGATKKFQIRGWLITRDGVDRAGTPWLESNGSGVYSAPLGAEWYAESIASWLCVDCADYEAILPFAVAIDYAGKVTEVIRDSFARLCSGADDHAKGMPFDREDLLECFRVEHV